MRLITYRTLQFALIGFCIELVLIIVLFIISALYPSGSWKVILDNMLSLLGFVYNLNFPITQIFKGFNTGLDAFWVDGLPLLMIGFLITGTIYGGVIGRVVSFVQYGIRKQESAYSARAIKFYKKIFIIIGSLIFVAIIYTITKYMDPIYKFRSSFDSQKYYAVYSCVMKGRDIVPYLKKRYSQYSKSIISEKEEEEKVGILYVMGYIGTGDDLDIIFEAINDTDPYIRHMALMSLEKITPSRRVRRRLSKIIQKESVIDEDWYTMMERDMAKIELEIKQDNKWPMKKEMMPLLFNLLNDDDLSSIPSFPFMEYHGLMLRINNRALIYLLKLIDYDEFGKYIYEIKLKEGYTRYVGWLNTNETWSEAIEFINKFWAENEPYLYWVWVDDQRETGPLTYYNDDIQIYDLYDKKLKINQQAKELGLPVDEDTGEILDPKDGHKLTQEEREQIKSNKSIPTIDNKTPNEPDKAK